MKIRLCLLLVTVCLSACSRSAPTDISSIIQRLRTTKLEFGNQQLIQTETQANFQLKQQLLNLLLETVNDDSVAWKTGRDIENLLEQRLKKLKIEKLQGQENEFTNSNVNFPCYYGSIAPIQVSLIDGLPDLLSAQISVGVCCGFDASFYVIKRVRGKWMVIGKDQLIEYKDLADGYNTYDWQVLKKESETIYLVAEVMKPYCASVWHDLTIKVFKLNLTGDTFASIYSRMENINLERRPPYSVETNSKGFTVEFSARNENPLDPYPTFIKKESFEIFDGLVRLSEQ